MVAVEGIKSGHTKVGFLLGLGILFLPIVFVWWLLKPGYSASARVIGFAWLGLILVVAFNTNHDVSPARQDVAAPSSSSDIASSSASASTTPSSPRETASKWSYSQDTDQMRGTTTRYATLESENTLEFGFPYKGGTAKLILRRRPEDGLNVLLNVDGQFICNSYSGDTVAAKFDDGPIRKFGCSEPNDGSVGWLFIEGSSRFVAAMRKAKSVTIEAQFYQEGRKQMQFDVSGLNWK